MKKIIATTAALMLLGTVASTASAATINFSGDARARFYYKDNYAFTATQGSEESYWQSRVRLVFKIETKGGAYAVGRFRLTDTFNGGTGGWDGSNNGSYGTKGNYTNNVNNFRADIAYVGIPLAGGYAIEAGVGPNTMDRFFRMDTPYNFIRAKYENKDSGTTVLAFLEKFSEYYDKNGIGIHGTATAVQQDRDDDDVNNYGIRVTQKLAAGWLLDAAAFYLDDQQTNMNGVGLVGRVSGKIEAVTVYGGAGFKSSDYMKWLTSANPAAANQTGQGIAPYNTPGVVDTNGWGFFAGVNVPVNIVSIGLTAGMTFNGYTASSDFGGDFDGVPFVMIGNGSQNLVSGMLNTGVLLGSYNSNAWFVNVAPSVKVSDKLTLTAESTYVNVDTRHIVTNDYTNQNINLIEIGGIAQYQITDGAKITGLIGYLNIQDAPQNPFGIGVSLDLSF